MRFHKYHGAGNDFLLLDNRRAGITLSCEAIRHLCHRHLGIGADGLMLLNPGRDGYDFTMEYFNSDGSGGMMCGNGGRCIVAFAHDLGIAARCFLAPDGPHKARILSSSGSGKIISLGMKDVEEVKRISTTDYFLDTGTRHVVRFVDDMSQLVIDDDVVALRHDPRFAPQGANVNIVFRDSDSLRVRTFEKGVEAETMACGTGVVASALAAHNRYALSDNDVAVSTAGGNFIVGFTLGKGGYENVTLTGPTQFVAVIDTVLEGSIA